MTAAAALAAVLLSAAWVGPGLLDERGLADRLLQQSYKLPELVSAYIPDLLQAVRLSAVSAAGTATVAYVAWVLVVRLGRPTGPGQVGAGWRLITWIVLATATAVATFVLVSWVILGTLDTVDGAAARWMSFGCAAGAPLVFWLLCLLGTEPMMRPAVPLGRFGIRA